MSQQHPMSTELLIDYVDGIIGSEARERVETAIRENEETAGIVAGIRAFYDENGEDRDALEEWLSKGHSPNEHAENTTVVRRLLPWSKIAVAIAAAAILVFAYIAMQDTRFSIANDFAALPVEVEFETRSTDDLSTIITAFDSQQFEQVLTLSETIEEESAQLDFMLGVSYFKTEDYPMAVAMLVGLEGTRLEEYAAWYVALSYAVTEQNERAEREMGKIAAGNGKYAKDAASWLEVQ